MKKVAAGATLIIPLPSMSGIAYHMDPAMQLLNLYVDQGSPNTPKAFKTPKQNSGPSYSGSKNKISKQPKKKHQIITSTTLNWGGGVFIPMVAWHFFVTPPQSTPDSAALAPQQSRCVDGLAGKPAATAPDAADGASLGRVF